jgi:hypothetical protein
MRKSTAVAETLVNEFGGNFMRLSTAESAE